MSSQYLLIGESVIRRGKPKKAKIKLRTSLIIANKVILLPLMRLGLIIYQYLVFLRELRVLRGEILLFCSPGGFLEFTLMKIKDALTNHDATVIIIPVPLSVIICQCRYFTQMANFFMMAVNFKTLEQ